MMPGSCSSSGVAAAARMLWPLVGACMAVAVLGYKPVIVVHGLFDSSSDFENLLRFINLVSRNMGSYWNFT